MSHPVESILRTGLRRLLQYGVPLSALALILPAPTAENGLLAYVLVHLAIVQGLTLLFTHEMAFLTDEPWFGDLRRPWLASSASLISAAVGFSALLTLATSAAARYDVSLQFLQLLSALDIAWVVAALYLGSRRMWGPKAGSILGSLLVLACIGSIAIYLKVVGFGPGGGWLIDGSELLRIVLPADTLAAIIGVAVLLAAARGVDQAIEQPRAQS